MIVFAIALFAVIAYFGAIAVLAWWLGKTYSPVDEVEPEHFRTNHGRKMVPPRSPARKKRGL